MVIFARTYLIRVAGERCIVYMQWGRVVVSNHYAYDDLSIHICGDSRRTTYTRHDITFIHQFCRQFN